MNNSISYIVPTFNSEKTLEQTIDSIVNGNINEGDEIIIVDDASTDSTAAIIKKLATSYSYIKTARHTINKGSAAAGRNTAIDIAKNDLLFCLDSDNLLIPHSAHALANYMLNQKADAGAFNELRFFIESPLKPTHSWYFKKGSITLGDALAGMIWPGPSGNYLFTKESWRRAGRYNESVGGAYDSWAFGIQQLATHTTMVTMPDSWYLHRHGYSSTFEKDKDKVSSSYIALSVLARFFDQIEPADLEYILNREHRTTWFSEIEKHPIKVKGHQAGVQGSIVHHQKPTLLERIIQKIKNLI